MNQGKVVIIGAGHVGSHCAYALAASGVCGEIVLVDSVAEKAAAQALDVAESTVIVLDPMFATGGSATAAVQFLKDRGCKDLRLVCLVAAQPAIDKMSEEHPDVPIYCAALDERLNENAYIVPGLGDAGDRIFGTK